MTRLVALVLALTAAAPAWADDSQTCTGLDDSPALVGVDIESRLAFLGAEFEREVTKINAWSVSWASIYGAVGIAQTGFAVSMGPENPARPTLTFGAAAAAFGALSLGLLPLRLTLPLTKLRWSTTDRCQLLRDAEAALAQVANDQRFIKGWQGHIGNVLVNAALLLILGLGYGQWTSGAIAGGLGLLVGELNLWTQPAGLMDVSQRYREGNFERLPLSHFDD